MFMAENKRYAPQFNVFEEDFFPSSSSMPFASSSMKEKHSYAENHASRKIIVHLRSIRDV
jgi:hypothetical protein